MSTPRHEGEGNPLGRCNSENKSPTESLCLSDPGRERQAACATGRWSHCGAGELIGKLDRMHQPERGSLIDLPPLPSRRDMN